MLCPEPGKREGCTETRENLRTIGLELEGSMAVTGSNTFVLKAGKPLSTKAV